ncbi:hypothetical protein L9F63_013775, partial [Diploptera punctata]
GEHVYSILGNPIGYLRPQEALGGFSVPLFNSVALNSTSLQIVTNSLENVEGIDSVNGKFNFYLGTIKMRMWNMQTRKMSLIIYLMNLNNVILLRSFPSLAPPFILFISNNPQQFNKLSFFSKFSEEEVTISQFLVWLVPQHEMHVLVYSALQQIETGMLRHDNGYHNMFSALIMYILISIVVIILPWSKIIVKSNMAISSRTLGGK